MAVTYTLQVYIPKYGSATSTTVPKTVTVDGSAKSSGSGLGLTKYWGLKDKLLQPQTIDPSYVFSLGDFLQDVEHTIILDFDSLWFNPNDVDIYVSMQNWMGWNSTNQDNITLKKAVWDNSQVTLTVQHAYAGSTNQWVLVAFFPKAGSTPTETYTFKRNANIENATCNYANNENIDTAKAITITANEGYQFDGASYPISYGDSTGYFTISSDKSTLTYSNLQSKTNYSIDTDIVANAIPIVTYVFLLEGNIINATCNYNNNDEIDTSKNVIITALEGYEFTGSYKIYYGENEGYFTVSADKKTLTYDKLTAGYNYIIKDDIQATQEGLHYFTLTGGLYNCTCNYTDGELVNSYKRLEITASANMYFKDTFYITKGTEKVELVKNDDATMMYLELDGNYNYNIADNIYSTKATTKYKVHISGTITNATCNYSNGEYISKLKPTLTITAKKGYEFKLNTYYLEEGATTVEFDINDDNTVLSYTLDNYEYYLEDTYNATKTTALASDFTHLYYVTKDQLNALAKQRFVTSGTTVVDYGAYITKLYYLPFVIGSDYLDESENITLGYFTSTTKGTIINADTFVYDLPSITYEGKYKNVYDYKGISFEFNVPFFDKFELDPKYVVGHTLTFTIKFNVYSNKCSLYVSSDVAGGYIYNADCTLGVDIPFINTDNKAVINNMGVLNPNISNNLIMTVYRNSPAGTVDEYGKEVNQYVTIGDVKGHALFDECTIISEVATDNELNIITNLLKSGVIIS